MIIGPDNRAVCLSGSGSIGRGAPPVHRSGSGSERTPLYCDRGLYMVVYEIQPCVNRPAVFETCLEAAQSISFGPLIFHE